MSMERTWVGGMVGGIVIALAGLAAAVPVSAANPNPATAIDLSYYHGCAVRSNGTVWCWGAADDGELGDGTTGGADSRSPNPVQVRTRNGVLSGIKAVSAGGSHSCALTTTGRAWCWGKGTLGELGDGTYGGGTGRRLKAVKVRLQGTLMTGVSQIAAGNDHTCFLRSGGVWCVGLDERGQLGDGTTGGKWNSRVQPVHVRLGDGFLTNVRAVAAGSDHTCAVRNDGSVWCWGDDRSGQLGNGGPGSADRQLSAVRVKKAGGRWLAGIVRIDTSRFTTCGQTVAGQLWCWGNDNVGQAGDGVSGTDRVLHRATRAHPGTPAGDAGGRIGAGAGHTCIAAKDGTPWCWGSASVGAVGDGTNGDAAYLRMQPVHVVTIGGPLADVRSVSAGYFHTCWLDASGVVWCHGANDWGQLGRGTITASELTAAPVLFP